MVDQNIEGLLAREINSCTINAQMPNRKRNQILCTGHWPENEGHSSAVGGLRDIDFFVKVIYLKMEICHLALDRGIYFK